jgi:hypothetical protein
MAAAADFYRTGGIDVVLNGLRDNNIRFSWPG